MPTKYQTLSGFLLSPFHGKEDVQKDASYDAKYRSFVTSNKIKIHAMCIIEDSYYLHMKVPSESQKDGNYEYDVVIRFFTDNPDTKSQPNLRGYYLQFFSNSPSFMYQYAYLYKQEGFLIEALYNKIDADYIDTPPEKTNSNMVKSYDKSIYFACRYLQDKKFRYLDKNGFLLAKKVSEKRFFQDITDFKSVKLDASLISEERKLKKILEDKSPRSVISKTLHTGDSHTPKSGKKKATRNTTRDGTTSITLIKKKTGGVKIVKRTAGRTTRKK